MKNAVLTRNVSGQGYSLNKGTKVWVCQKDEYQAFVRLFKNDLHEFVVSTDALRMINKVEVDVHVKRKPYRNDSMFYFGRHIATVSNTDRNLIIESCGDMEAAFSPNGNSYSNDKLYKQLLTRKFTDKKLSRISKDDLVSMNNWFRIIDEDTNEEVAIQHTYDGAIAAAKKMIK